MHSLFFTRSLPYTVIQSRAPLTAIHCHCHTVKSVTTHCWYTVIAIQSITPHTTVHTHCHTVKNATHYCTLSLPYSQERHYPLLVHCHCHTVKNATHYCNLPLPYSQERHTLLYTVIAIHSRAPFTAIRCHCHTVKNATHYCTLPLPYSQERHYPLLVHCHYHTVKSVTTHCHTLSSSYIQRAPHTAIMEHTELSTYNTAAMPQYLLSHSPTVSTMCSCITCKCILNSLAFYFHTAPL